MSHPFLAAFQKALAHIGDYQLKKGDAVWNKTYGIGKFEKTDPLNARLGYVRFEKKSDGKYVQHIGILGLKRQKVFGGKWESVIERQYLPGETVTERAFRDLDTGTATQDMVRAADGYHVLVSIAERVGLGESARDLTGTQFALWRAGLHANPGFPRHFGRVMRNLYIDSLRRMYAQKRRDSGARRADLKHWTNAARQRAYRERQKALRIAANK